MAEDTIFHKIIRKEIPAKIVYEDEEMIAFRDVNPVAPTHILIVPKETLTGVQAAEPKHAELLGKLLIQARSIAEQEGLENSGYRLVTNCGAGAGQSVFQLHIHLIGGRPLEWPPG